MKWALIFLSIGCSRPEKIDISGGLADEATEIIDGDGDGYLNTEDCDDNEGTTHPGAIEICDGIDNDCDMQIDETVTVLFYADSDGDGFGNESDFINACEAPEGYIPVGNDCDDQNALVNPGMPEICDEIDNNCDGISDDSNEGSWYPDTDSDGFGDSAGVHVGCNPGSGYVSNDRDCNDSNPDISPMGLEVCDERDNDCDGQTDEGVMIAFYSDIDSDQYGDPNQSTEACEAPPGHVSNNEDCNDFEYWINPNADEQCDFIDNNCDGLIDDNSSIDQIEFNLDQDGDGHGDPTLTITACVQEAGMADNDGDCNDSDSSIYPGAPEVCNSQDDDCDGIIDEDSGNASFSPDADGDGYGDDSIVVFACSAPPGHVSNSEDCNDSNPSISPGSLETCNNIDDNCNGLADDGIPTLAWSPDSDGDGYGSEATSIQSCAAPIGHVTNSLDCDDSDSSINPGASEICNSIDDDCNGMIDGPGSVDAQMWYIDIDLDGHGSSQYSMPACDQPNGWTEFDDDCDDNNPAIHPDALEICNGVDDDCDGIVDTSSMNAQTWHADTDCDGHGDPAVTVIACAAPAGFVADDSDCDDSNSRVHPQAEELCLSTGTVDHDCNGIADDNCIDVVEISPPSHGSLDSPGFQGACATFADLNITVNSHSWANLPLHMAEIEATSSTTSSDVILLDYSTRCGSNYTASPGNYTGSTQPWGNIGSGNQGAARFRGYILIGCGESLNKTIGMIGNDALKLIIEGQDIMTMHWLDGQWKKFRHISFPEPGLYAFEAQWSTNFICDIDPFELIWSDGFLNGYGFYDSMCEWSSCTYGNGQAVPGFSVINSNSLVQTSSGEASNCQECNTDNDCPSNDVCNSAKICEGLP